MKTISKTRLPLSDTAAPAASVTRRRAVGLMAGAAVAAGLVPARAWAVSPGQAEALIGQVVGEVMQIVDSGASRATVLKQFEGIFVKYGDVPRIARSLVGPAWNQASAAERNAYVAALGGYLARKYGARFEDSRGAKISVQGSKDFGSKGVIVQTVIATDAYAPFPVEWHVIDSSGGHKFFDLIVEGVRLVSTERGEIRALLDRNRGSVGQLAQALQSLG